MPDYLDRLDRIEARQAEAEALDQHAAWLLGIQARPLRSWRLWELEAIAADTGALLIAGLAPAIGWLELGTMLRRLAGYRNGG